MQHSGQGQQAHCIFQDSFHSDPQYVYMLKKSVYLSQRIVASFIVLWCLWQDINSQRAEGICTLSKMWDLVQSLEQYSQTTAFLSPEL